MNTTIKFVTDTDSDANGKEIKYHFNNAGNLISSYDEMWHAVAAEYDSGIDNTPSATSTLIKSVINRLPNTDFYSGWTTVKTHYDDECEISAGTYCMSMECLEIKKDGPGELVKKIDAQLFESGYYTFSAFMKTTGLILASGHKGAFLRVTSNGNIYESRAAFSSTAGKGTGTFAEGWERLNVYTFDDHKNPVSVKDRSNQQSAATYDSCDNLPSYVQPGSASTDKYLFTYGDTEAEQKRHLPRTATTPEGVKTATTYDSYGNALTSTIQENTTAPLIRTETEYTADGNYVTKQKDARGNEVTNTLDANGKVLSVTDPAGQTVGYTYDSSNRVTKVETVFTQDGQTRTSKNEYTYENDRIKTVSHNTTDNNTSDLSQQSSNL